jgi:hypothetical protein
MGDEVVPGGDLAVQVLGVGVGQRAEGQIPVEGVVTVEGELLDLLSALHHRGIFETVA